jgi:Flp pilus assembly protein TadD/predicted HTH domain antitoxin
MMLELRQQFGSPTADLGVVAYLSPGSFADLKRRATTKSRTGSTSVRKSSVSSDHVNLQFEEVVQYLRRGAHLTPHDPVAAFNLGYAYKTLGRWKESADAFTKALEFLAQTDDKYRTRNLAITYFMRGYAYASLATKQEGDEARRDLEKAESDYLEVLKLKKDYMLVYCYLGVLYGMQSRWSEAERALKKAIRIKPRSAGAHHDLGVIYIQSGRTKLALKAFEKAAQYEPKNLLSLRHLTKVYYEAERWEDARKILLRVLKLDPHDQDALYKLGGAYLNLGNFRKAEKALLNVLELDPTDPVAYSNLGLIYLKSDRLGEAADVFNKALELDHPDKDGIRSSLNAVQLSMLTVVADTYFEALSYGEKILVDELIDYLAQVRARISLGDKEPLSTPAACFPNQLISVLSPMVEHLDKDSRFLLAAKLFERGLISSGKASQMIGMPRVTFLLNLHKVGVAMLDLSPEELEEEVRYATAE